MITMVPIRVRLLDPTQLPVAARIVDVQRAAYQVEADLISFAAIPPLTETAIEVSRLQLCLLGLFEETELCAFIGYQRLDTTVDIDRLAVHPSRFRRGFARTLLDSMHSREPDARCFSVSTGAANLPAVALYEKAGYRRLPDRRLTEGPTIAYFCRP